MARILVACEFSGIVREAFTAQGHEAYSCDLEPSERPGPHIQGDVLEVLAEGWDLMLAFPPCTYLARSGERWMRERPERGPLRAQAIAFVEALLAAPIPHIALENPVGCLARVLTLPHQTIQPWEYGEPYCKATCLWLKQLPYLQPTCLSAARHHAIHLMPARKTRQRDKSRTPQGIAAAMAQQWGHFLERTTE